MTLIVSLRIPDGIVLAGDSLATMMGDFQAFKKVPVTCPSCAHNHETLAVVDGIHYPATTFSYAQKVFPFMGEYGVGTSGIGQLMGKTIYFAMRELEAKIQQLPASKRPKNVVEVADLIGDHFLELLKKQYKTDQRPIEGRPLGFQVVGYKAGVAQTIELQIGKTVLSKTSNNAGVTVTGMTQLTETFFERYNKEDEEKPAFYVFSLQDAIAYAEFLINTTAAYQTFSKNFASVGGEIDVALITPFDHFTWIRQKTLQTILGGANEQSYN